ncbi:MAG: biosynthetic-type acetolactate synthase large subunit [Elusimicrobia bacterium]|nr:biosynthetic-type acetolactate synthase large subunit [Elusimicrobiota bacterium]
MKLKGSEIIIKCLEREGVDTIFGIPGGSVIPLFDKLYSSKIKIVLTRHEQGAAHMADGYARASGKTGVCVATSGPGATNLTTGIATAHMDSVPVVAITGQVGRHLVGNDAFQEADTTGISRPITKQNYLVTSAKDLPKIFAEAFYLAKSGRPGPVLIDIPVDVQNETAEVSFPKPEIRGYKPKTEGHPKQIKAAIEELKKAQRPLIYAGGGIILSGASRELTAFARKFKIPVTLTLMGIGGFPGSDKLFIGMPGMHGSLTANRAMQNCDLMIAIGSRFDDRVTGRVDAFAPKAKIVHIDIDPTSISKNVAADIPIVGDCKVVLRQILDYASKKNLKLNFSRWADDLKKFERQKPLKYKKDSVLRPQYVVERIYELTKGRAIIATEVGQNQMWAQQFYKYDSPRKFLSSGGLGTMGYGFPAAIGAKVACPKEIVIDIAGDGSIQMNIQELATAKVYGIKVIIAILNNRYLGMVRQWQELFYDRRYSAVYLGDRQSKNYWPDFKKLAEAYGLKGIAVSKKKDVDAAISEALNCRETCVIDFRVSEEENVSPMVPGGATLDHILELA